MTKCKLEEEDYLNLLREYKENIDNSSSYIFYGLKTIAYCFKVIDGDTIKCMIKSPDGESFLKVIVRLDGVDTAEKKSIVEAEKKLAEKASLFTKTLLEDKLVELHFLKTDKYGRHLCNVYQVTRPGQTMTGGSVSQQLIDNKLANEYDGGKKENFESITNASN